MTEQTSSTGQAAAIAAELANWGQALAIIGTVVGGLLIVVGVVGAMNGGSSGWSLAITGLILILGGFLARTLCEAASAALRLMAEK